MDRNKLKWIRPIMLVAVVSIAFQSLPPASFPGLLPAPAYAAGINVSDNEGNSILPEIALSEDGESVYIVWQDASSGNNEILFAASEDQGLSFGEPVNISDTEGASSLPQLAVEGENIYIVWQEGAPSNDIFVSSSSDGGSSFGEPINVSNTTDGSSTSPQFAVSGNNVYVAWQDNAAGNLEVLFAASDNAGSDFDEVINVSNTTDGVSSSPQVVLSDEGTVHVLWQDTFPSSDIFIASKAQGAEDFDDPVNVSDTEDGVSSVPKAVGKGAGEIFVAWQDSSPGNNDVFFASSTDGGSTFDVTNISENSGVSVTPSLIADEATETIYVTWGDNTDTGGAFDVFFASSTDGGISFGDPVNVSANSGISSLPQVHLISGTETVYLTWMDNSLDISNNEIMLGASPDGGDTFGCAINVSNNPTSSSTPQLILASGSETVHVVWQDLIETGNFEVLLNSGLVPAETSMTIDTVSDTSPRWDLDDVEVSGALGSGSIETDTVTVNWGDGTSTEDIPVSGCDWGPVSHSYSSAALATNPNQIEAMLFSENGTQKAAASPAEVSVQKHATSLTLDPVSSIVQGAELTVAGLLVDADAEEGIGGMNITFSGTGANGILEQTITESGGDLGDYSSTGTTPNATASLQSVQAHFAGDGLYEASESVVRTFDIVSEAAVRIDITEEDPVVDIDGLITFNATIEFEELLSDGFVYVSECESPASSRYTSLDLCLSVSTGVEMAPGSTASVTASFDGKLPDGAVPEQVNIFHEELTSDGVVIVDITSARDPDVETVTGTTDSFSRFVVGLAEHGSEPAGVHRTQIFLGDGNVVNLRDISNLQNSSATASASFDKSSYEMSDQPILTIVDENGNVDPGKQDVVTAGVKSESSDPDVLTITLVENGTNTGAFEGSFSFTDDVTSTESGVLHAAANDELTVHYLSGARAQVIVDGVTEAGIAQISDSIVDEGACLKPVGAAINVELIDSQLGPDGLLTVTIGYSNAVLRGFDPESFRMVHKADEIWSDVTLPDGVDTDAMTVTGQANSTGAFSIAADVDDCSGGAGGGIGRPGSGLVVDFVASIARSSEESDSGGSSSGGSGGGSRSASATGPASSGTSGTVPAGQDNEIVVTLVNREDAAASFGIDISEVKLVFENVNAAGSVNVAAASVEEVSNLFDDSEGGLATTEIDDSEYSAIGEVFEIRASSELTFDGFIDVTIPFDESQIGSIDGDSGEGDVRFLHHNGMAWEDVTTGINTTANTVTGRMSGFSPVVAAVIDDGTFGSAYFENNPLAKMSVIEPVITDGIIPDPLQSVAVGQEVTISATVKNAQRAEQPYIFIIEVFSPTGHVESVMIESAELGHGETSMMSAKWKAAENLAAGIYEIKILVLSSFDQPYILADVASSKLEVLVDQQT